MARIFVHIFEVGEFFGSRFMNKARDTHWIDILEVFFLYGPCFLRGLSLNDWLMLVSNKSRY